MADTTTTGAATDVTVDKSTVDTVEKRKRIIKWVVIIALVVVVVWLVRKYVLK